MVFAQIMYFSECKNLGAEMEKPLSLIRADHKNALFDELNQQWHGQLQAYGATMEEYAAAHMQHACDIAGEKPRSARYGIYLLHDFAEDGERIYHGLLHANAARLPQTTGVTLRFNWILLSPQYDFEDIPVNDFAKVSAGVIFGGAKLCQKELKADHFKVHLRSIGDRRFAVAMAYGLAINKDETTVEVRGNWLHIDNVPTLEG